MPAIIANALSQAEQPQRRQIRKTPSPPDRKGQHHGGENQRRVRPARWRVSTAPALSGLTPGCISSLNRFQEVNRRAQAEAERTRWSATTLANCSPCPSNQKHGARQHHRENTRQRCMRTSRPPSGTRARLKDRDQRELYLSGRD